MAGRRVRNPLEDTTRTFDPVGQGSPEESQPRPCIIVLAGTGVGEMYQITKEKTVMGRGDKTDIRLIDEGISREHAQLVQEDAGDGTGEGGGKTFLEDLGSTNGTFCNGTRVVGRRALVHGDKILIGSNTILRFSYSDKLDETFQRQMTESALRDGLTHTFNKRYLNDRLGSEFTYADRHDTPLALIFFDIDHFKKINDRHGHPGGDAVLAELSALVAGMLLPEEILARYGGEEFAIISRGSRIGEAAEMAERVRRTVEAHPFVYQGQPIAVTISVGVAGLPDAGVHSASDLIAVADEVMYEAKRTGRNRVCVRKTGQDSGQDSGSDSGRGGGGAAPGG